MCDKLAVNIGLAILQLSPERVSTEVYARLSYDTEAYIKKRTVLLNFIIIQALKMSVF